MSQQGCTTWVEWGRWPSKHLTFTFGASSPTTAQLHTLVVGRIQTFIAMQSQYVYLSAITQPPIALYFSVELSTLYKSAGFTCECLQFWTCIYSTNGVICLFQSSLLTLLFTCCCHLPGSIAARHARTQRIVNDSTTREPSTRGSWKPGSESCGATTHFCRLFLEVGDSNKKTHGKNYTTWICEMDSQSFDIVNWEELNVLYIRKGNREV